MQQHQRIVFGNMGGPTQEKIKGPSDDPTYLHNTMVFEIAANWPYIFHLMVRVTTGSVKTVDKLERDWINFMLTNHVDVNKYGEDSDKFIEDLYKKN